MKYVHIGRLQTASANRKPGYLEAHMKAGRHIIKFGQPFVELSDDDYLALRKEFALTPRTDTSRAASTPSIKSTKSKTPAPVRRKIGLGDIIHAFALPIAKALNMDCVDKATGQLKPDSGCADRRDRANKIQLP